MNKAVSWRIKGVGFDARAAAIEAARRSGMSLGEWLNTVIADQAAADGVDEDDFDADDRLDAVTQRLSTLRDGRQGPSRDAARRRTERAPQRRVREERGRENHTRENHAREDFDDADFERRPSRENYREEFDAESLLQNAIAAFDRRANRSSERTARALGEVADLIDAGRRDRDRDDVALATIADRLSHIERRVARTPATSQSDPSVQDALARLERRIEGLARRPLSERVAPPPVQVQSPAARREAAAGPARRPLAAAIAEVARRQRELDAHGGRPDAFVAPPAARVRPPEAAQNPLEARQNPLEARHPLEARQNPLEARLAALVDRLEKSASRKPDAPPPAPDASNLKGHIDTLSDRIETMRAEFARGPALPLRDDDGIADIRRELAAMAKAIGDLAPRASVSALELAVRDLSARVTESRIDGVGEAALAPVESLVRELVGVVRGADPRAAIESLDRGVRAMVAKLETFDGAAVADPELARGIASQTREMRDTLARLSENQLPAERIERGLADLAARVEAIAKSGVDPLGRGEMAQRVGEIRAMLSDPLTQERTLQALDHRLEAVTGRIDAVFGERFDTMQRTFAAQLERARTSGVEPGVDTLVNDLGARIDSALSSGLKAMERTVARLVETNAPRAEAAPSRLEEMVRELAARIDTGAAPGAGSDAIEAVHSQIARLSEHFDRNDRTAETLVALQRSVSELFERLEQSHHTALDVAESAARGAAADALRDAPGSTPEMSRELADLRALQDAADNRTHATLTAVHDTLSQVVGRLSSLEDDLADVRHGDVRNGDVRQGDLRNGAVDGAGYAPLPPSRAEPRPRVPQGERAGFSVPEGRAAARDADEGDESDGADVLIEPGMAFDRRAENADADGRLEYRPQASFIQAARRAAQAAGAANEASAEPNARRAPAAKVPGKGVRQPAGAPLDQVRAYYASRKRPILLSLAALMVIFGAWQVARVVVDDRAPPPPPAVQTPKSSALPPREKIATDKAAPPVQTPAETPAAAAPETPAPTPPGRKADAAPVAVEAAPASVASTPPVDRAPVGTIGALGPAVDTNGIVRAFAVTGDSAAQYELAMRYADGKLLARDLKLSQQWFEKAAAKGIIPAQYRLGALYERGIGVPKDPVLAKQWYQRAADAGNARAMHNLAVMFADGSDGKPDYADAIVWFRRAAELGVRDSQFNLAILYARGLGTAVNMVESYVWFAAAASQGDEDSTRKRDDVATRLQANDLARAKALAAAFKAKPLDQAANEVAPPPGGWESMKPPPRPDVKTTQRPKISAL